MSYSFRGPPPFEKYPQQQQQQQQQQQKQQQQQQQQQQRLTKTYKQPVWQAAGLSGLLFEYC